MTSLTQFLSLALVLGAGATALVDLWSLVRRRLFGVPPPDWGLVGRWFGHMARGRFRHDRIAAAAPVRGERAIGWIAHYLVGVAFAGVLLAAAGLGWAARPTPGPALAVGLGSVAAPFLLMQPGMGAGIAASRTPRPAAARLQSVLTHAVFGAGLYATAAIANLLRAG